MSYSLSTNRMKQIVESLKMPFMKGRVEKNEVQIDDLFTKEEQCFAKWCDVPSLPGQIFNKDLIKFSIERQSFYRWDKIWKCIRGGKKTSITEDIYASALKDNFPTDIISYEKILNELMMQSQDFTKINEKMIRTRYKKYIFPNGTLNYNQENGDWNFEQGAWSPSDNVREEENPMFSFNFVQNLDGLSNLFRIMYQWRVSLKQVVYMISYIAFCDKDFLNIIFYLVGEGSNGKSMLLKLIATMFPAGTVPSLDISKLTGDKDGSEVLEKAYANISGEIKLDDFDTTFFKKITGGDDISVNVKYEAGTYTFRSTAKHVVSSNYNPRLKNTSHGDLRRILIMEFLKTFPLVVDFFSKEMEQYIPQLFFFCLKLSKKIKSGNMYIHEPYRLKTKNSIREESNSAYTFTNEFNIIYNSNVLNSQGNIGIDERSIFKKYVNWCRSVGKSPYSNQRLWKEIDVLFGVKTKLAGSTYNRLIEVLNDTELDKYSTKDLLI